MQIFRRKSFNQIWFTLRSNETLGVLDSSYLQDYFGNQEQVSLFNLETQQRFSVPMNELTGTDDPTPGVSHDVFSGYIDLTSIPDGSYKIQGLVRDVVGNYTILSEIQNPTGLEKVMQFDMRITDDEVVILFPDTSITMGIIFSAELPRRILEIDAEIRKFLQNSAQINNVSVFVSPIVEYLGVESLISKGVAGEVGITKTATFDADMNFNG